MLLSKALTGAGDASWGYCSASGSAELTQLLACLPALEKQTEAGESSPSLWRHSAMGEWFARSAGICWVEALQMLAVSVGFGRVGGAGWELGRL